MTQYRKKPVVIEAMQFTDETKDQCNNFVRCNTYADFEDGKPVLRIQTSEGIMTAKIGDYIIKEPFATPDRQFYPCKPDIFEATYDKVEPGIVVSNGITSTEND